ncbi:hypothetical protein N7449_005158 [Penicillium cf. viridicatum]|uniref:Uncharacterized protein n=1 Tax=Penicillium cf. viridicatum TaxID=2972119 RepID=A0A9W9MKT4_9EURO|nr:hypothetical protein N7449_005158 [Penicillium cf. viridicatum]
MAAPLLNGIVISLLLSAAFVSGHGNSRLRASPSYQGFNNICPEQCILAKCDQPMFYGFNLYDDVDDADSYYRILACTAYDNDWSENS